jgi:hypothetical protein
MRRIETSWRSASLVSGNQVVPTSSRRVPEELDALAVAGFAVAVSLSAYGSSLPGA